jgi:putative membrane protein
MIFMILVFFPGNALAALPIAMQRTGWSEGPWPWGWGMNYWGGAWGIGMMVFMLLFWILVIAGTVGIVRWFWGTENKPLETSDSGEEPWEILKRRYASGDIDQEEFRTLWREIRKA